jgi:hypothetical protein
MKAIQLGCEKLHQLHPLNARLEPHYRPDAEATTRHPPLREEIANTVAGPAEAEEELRHEHGTGKRRAILRAAKALLDSGIFQWLCWLPMCLVI